MKIVYETKMHEGMYAVVRGKNEYGEYVATLYNGNLSRGHRRAVATSYHTDDLEDACHTANAQVFGIKAAALATTLPPIKV